MAGLQAGAAAAVSRPAAGSAARAAVLPRPHLSGVELSPIRRQQPLPRAGDLIRNAVGPDLTRSGFAGIEFRGDMVVVWWKGSLTAPVAAAVSAARGIAPVQVRPAAHSQAELLAASRRLWAEAGVTQGGPLTGIRVPFDGSGLAAAVTPERAGSVTAAALPRVGVPVTVISQPPVTWTDTRCSDTPPFWGGGAIFNATVGIIGNQCNGNSSEQFHCTAGFGVTYGGSQYLTTAGHCGSVGDAFRTPAGRTIGTMAYKNQGQDLALIRASAGGQVWDGVPNSSDYARPVTGWGWPFSGESLCFSGTTSGNEICGGVVDFMWSTLCGADIRGKSECFDNLVSMKGIYPQHGDSGGPVFELDGTQSKALAVGSVTGIMSQHDESGTTNWTLFAEVGTAARDWPGLNVITGNGDLFPPAVTVLGSNTKTCPGSQQYFSTTDNSGVPIDWTYANGANQCVQVSYTPIYTPSSCTFSFYVPNKDATGYVDFRVGYTVNGNPHFTTYQLNENPVSGFTQVFTLSNVFSVTFGDNDGQSNPTQIGWGANIAASLRQNC